MIWNFHWLLMYKNTEEITRHIFKLYFSRYIETKMLCAVLNKSRKQHPTKKQLYSHLSPITQAFNWDKDIAGEVSMNSKATFPYGLLHMDTSMLADQQNLTFNSSVQTVEDIKKTNPKQSVIETNDERERQGVSSVDVPWLYMFRKGCGSNR